MTLKEKFKQWLDTNPNIIFRDTQCEKIADDYAIDFANWVIDTDDKPVGQFTIKELLEIFKKEKGL
jgi:uncharacterized protein YegJ (DUF2314 family)